MGTTHTAARHYLDLLEQTFVLRTLPPLERNLGKRLVYGASWEGFVVEQMLLRAQAADGWRASYYRTATGDELDLVLERSARRGRRARVVAIECKASSAPKVERGFWSSLRDLAITEAWVVAPVREGFPLGDGAEVLPLGEALGRLG